jgi:hypothetical protein
MKNSRSSLFRYACLISALCAENAHAQNAQAVFAKVSSSVVVIDWQAGQRRGHGAI